MNLDTASFDSVFSLIESAAAVGSVAASSWAFEALGYKRNERLSNGTKNGRENVFARKIVTVHLQG